MSIVIFGDMFQFPNGSAATNRVYTYAKGFKEQNVNVEVVCFGNDYLDEKQGISDGIKYYNPFGQKSRSTNFLIRQWKKVLKYIHAYNLLKKISKEEKIVAIVSYSNFLFTHVYAYFLSKLFKAKLLNECNEHPLRFYQGSYLNKM